MKLRKINCITLAAMLTLSMMTGCGSGGQTAETEEGLNAPETQTANNNTQMGTQTQEPESAGDTESTKAMVQTKYPQITAEDTIKDYHSVVTVGDSAFELYTYVDGTAENYAKSVNEVADRLAGKADVYDLVIPLSSEITFPDNLKEKINSGSQRDAMTKIQGKMNNHVKNVDIYDALMQHRNEYIYFRTDHHWTALGAFYAYEDFCEAKGIEPEPLEEREKVEFPGFVGSFYNDTKDAKLKAAPDTVAAYKPKDDAILHVTASDGTKYDWPVIYDVSNYGASLKYSTFIASDNPITVIENKVLTDNSTCIVVKESFGNAFIPFLVDHYQTIYVVDYRYWTGSISSLAEEKHASDVLFLNNLSMIRNKSLVGKLHRVI